MQSQIMIKINDLTTEKVTALATSTEECGLKRLKPSKQETKAMILAKNTLFISPLKISL